MMATTATTKPSSKVTKGAALAASFIFPIDPVPASRPRVTRWGTYHLKTYKTWLEAAGKYLKGLSHVAGQGIRPDTPLIVVAEFVCRKPKTTKLLTPKGDIDNYLKAPLDAITHAGLWGDDKWITTVVATKRFQEPGEEPHTALSVYEAPRESLFNQLTQFIRGIFRCD
ncbi:RusA family crossover junction endodeoxyribonuclease [Xanthomonas citri]|uniref:RusA family crossover junction endodeoxyribonuclease n=1 Tax=Xanthomonas citri TaxID=346 RepID=UPI00051D4ACC|nr:RusA family crossover junction endodeoxyribonuclease [Xanthomonas citri]KGK67060.1 hypothetical protein NB99_04880 [Xanthomonas citri pv. fuscans]